MIKVQTVMKQNSLGIIVLAAGKGTRMKSDNPKVIHKLKDKPMINWVLEASTPLAGKNVVVVVGFKREMVESEVGRCFDVTFAEQKELLGTGDAVKAALPKINNPIETLIILCGDVPLIRTETLERLVTYHKNEKNDVTVLCVNVENPYGYGRILVSEDGSFLGIREEADANDREKEIRTINSGIYCVEKPFLEKALELIRADNVQNEYYLTDIVGVAGKLGGRSGFMIGKDPVEVTGVNTVAELKMAESLISVTGMDNRR